MLQSGKTENILNISLLDQSQMASTNYKNIFNEMVDKTYLKTLNIFIKKYLKL